MGLLVSVYRSSDIGDCTLNGISSKAKGLCLTNVKGPFDPSDEYPAAVLLAKRAIGVEIPVIYPLDKTTTSKWYMMGGNYAATSDSRFSEAVQKIAGPTFYGAVPIHDRYEG